MRKSCRRMWASSWARIISIWSVDSPLSVAIGRRMTGRRKPITVGTSTAADSSSVTPRRRFSASANRAAARCQSRPAGTAFRFAISCARIQPKRRRMESSSTPIAQIRTMVGKCGAAVATARAKSCAVVGVLLAATVERSAVVSRSVAACMVTVAGKAGVASAAGS